MDLLIDTHSIVWLVTDAPQLGLAVREALRREDVRFFVSAVTTYPVKTLW